MSAMRDTELTPDLMFSFAVVLILGLTVGDCTAHEAEAKNRCPQCGDHAVVVKPDEKSWDWKSWTCRCELP